jgi:phosphonate transport system substrate-binding protein
MRNDFQPMANWLARKIGGRALQIEPSVSFASFEDKIREARPEWLIANPWQSLLAMKHGYTVIAMTGEPEDFRGVFLARRDRGISPEGDWRGLSFAYPSPTALAACLLPQWNLHQRGIDVKTEVKSFYVGTQESAILNVLDRITDVGVTWTVPWAHFQRDEPELAAQLTVLAVTEASSTNNAVLARKTVAPERIALMRTTLLRMHETEGGLPLFGAVGFTHFRPATDQDYAAVQTFIERFEAEVRSVD